MTLHIKAEAAEVALQWHFYLFQWHIYSYLQNQVLPWQSDHACL